jgi:hypothetical protein
MNQLSWLLYLADVSASSEGWLIFFGGLATLVSNIMLLVVSGIKGDGDEPPAFLGQALFVSIPTLLVCVLLSVFLPSKETVYAIAASELGEQVMNSDTGQRAGRALNAWLDKQIGASEPAAPATPETD